MATENVKLSLILRIEKDFYLLQIKCISNNDKHNCSRTVLGNITMVTIRDLHPDLTYTIKVAARTGSGAGEWSKAITFGE